MDFTDFRYEALIADMHMTQIFKCPFCRETVTLNKYPVTETYSTSSGLDYLFRVKCPHCNLHIGLFRRPYYVTPSTYNASEKEVFDVYNSPNLTFSIRNFRFLYS